ncbi:hypothetical protein BDP55DRAFT_663217, partial [Colletotrichum godetiae]
MAASSTCCLARFPAFLWPQCSLFAPVLCVVPHYDTQRRHSNTHEASAQQREAKPSYPLSVLSPRSYVFHKSFVSLTSIPTPSAFIRQYMRQQRGGKPKSLAPFPKFHWHLEGGKPRQLRAGHGPINGLSRFHESAIRTAIVRKGKEGSFLKDPGAAKAHIG